MSKLVDVGIIDGEDGCWGSKHRFPTRQAFVDAVNTETGFDVSVCDVTEAYMRRLPRMPRKDEGVYDSRVGIWRVCDGPARGATPVWECS